MYIEYVPVQVNRRSQSGWATGTGPGGCKHCSTWLLTVDCRIRFEDPSSRLTNEKSGCARVIGEFGEFICDGLSTRRVCYDGSGNGKDGPDVAVPWALGEGS